jgi:hypothetical protein
MRMAVDVVSCWKTTCLPLRRREGKSRPSLVNVLTVRVADPTRENVLKKLEIISRI